MSVRTQPRPGRGWPREVAPHDLDQYGIRVTSVVAPVPGATPERLSDLPRSCWHVLNGMGRPAGVLELAARIGHPPITTAVGVSELLRGGWARKIMPPVAPESGRLRQLTDGRRSPRLFHDLWLFISGSDHSPAAVGGLCQRGQGVMRLVADDLNGQGALWLGALADATAYVSLMGVSGVRADSEHWDWLTHAACGAVLVVDGHDPEACAPLAQTLSERGVPMVVLVDTGRCTEAPDEQNVRKALGVPRTLPMVFGRADAPTDIDEALCDLEEHLHLQRSGLSLSTQLGTDIATIKEAS